MKPTLEYSVVTELSDAQARQLHGLYEDEWWTKGRSLEDVQTMLRHSDLIFGVVDPRSQRLLAFARVLTDRVFKAFIFDVIVHPDHRSAGLGSFLMAHLTAHPIISRVRHVELYCLPERASFYQRFRFSAEIGAARLMRRSTEFRSPPGASEPV